jgi:hypothetical protein
MKQAGIIAIIIAAVLFIAAGATAIGNIGDVQRDLDGPQPGMPWQAQVAIEAVVGFLFFIPGVVLITRKDESSR